MGEVAKDPEIQTKLAGEIRALSTRVPKSGTEDLDFPTEESFGADFISKPLVQGCQNRLSLR